MSRTVVIALDRSDLSARALPFAQAIARHWRGQLVLVHAVEAGEASVVAHRERELQKDKIIGELRDAGIDADAVVRVAPPAQAIVDIARERHADLIVMASHQRAGLNRWLNGSVTEEVLTKTSIPLMVIPAHGTPELKSSVHALVPLDGSSIGEAPLEVLRGHSTNLPLELLLVRVLSNNSMVIGVEQMYSVEPLTSADYEVELHDARTYLAGVAETLRDANTSARYQVIETSEPIARVILEVARRDQADLIALGTHAKAGVPRLVLGSVSEAILEHSPVPVLLVRQTTGAGPGSVRVGDRMAMTS